MRRLTALSACLFALAAMPAHATTVPHYKISLIGGDAAYSSGYGLSPTGQVVGEAPGPAAAGQAALWSVGGARQYTGSDYSLLYAINSAGTAVGNSYDSGTMYASRLSGGVLSTYGAPGTENYLRSINEAGDATGWQRVWNPSIGMWDISVISLSADGVFSVGPSLGSYWGDDPTAAAVWDINNAGVILGNAANFGDGNSDIFTIDADGMHNIGTMGGTTALASAINDAGVIVGQSTYSDANDATHAVRWANGVWTDLGTLAGDDYGVSSAVFDINNLGEMVGVSYTDASATDMRATIWVDDQIYDLATLLNNGQGWTLSYANAVNDDGQIVGTGYLNGVQHAFLLTPEEASDGGAVPEPASWALMLAGFGLVGGTLRSRSRSYAPAI